MYIISGRGRKSGVARATGATASLAPMQIEYIPVDHIFVLVEWLVGKLVPFVVVCLIVLEVA